MSSMPPTPRSAPKPPHKSRGAEKAAYVDYLISMRIQGEEKCRARNQHKHDDEKQTRRGCSTGQQRATLGKHLRRRPSFSPKAGVSDVFEVGFLGKFHWTWRDSSYLERPAFATVRTAREGPNFDCPLLSASSIKDNILCVTASFGCPLASRIALAVLRSSSTSDGER